MIKTGITGGRGFIGKHLVETFKNKKNIKVFCCDMPDCDILKEDSLKEFVKDKNVIIHAAAINRGTDIEVVAGSVVGTYNLISAMEKHKSRAKLIFLSSIQAETDTLYGKSKRLAEIMLEDFSRRTKIPVAIFRLTNVFGEGCKPFYNSVVATFCHQIANNKELTINPESRNKKINLIYVGDVIEIIIEEIKKYRKNPFYFKRVNLKNEISVGNLAKLMQSFKNKPKLKSKFHKDLYKTYLSHT
ncbi:MAG: NAD-dependent epimerase/dehydratase family protein [bacterium]|nr:NAD-dependent epimerase/dehydratase family protein [bacterium]